MKLFVASMVWITVSYFGEQLAEERAIEALKRINAEITVLQGIQGKELSIDFAGSSVDNAHMKHLEHLPHVCNIDL